MREITVRQRRVFSGRYGCIMVEPRIDATSRLRLVLAQHLDDDPEHKMLPWHQSILDVATGDLGGRGRVKYLRAPRRGGAASFVRYCLAGEAEVSAVEIVYTREFDVFGADDDGTTYCLAEGGVWRDGDLYFVIERPGTPVWRDASFVGYLNRLASRALPPHVCDCIIDETGDGVCYNGRVHDFDPRGRPRCCWYTGGWAPLVVVVTFDSGSEFDDGGNWDLWGVDADMRLVQRARALAAE